MNVGTIVLEGLGACQTMRCFSTSGVKSSGVEWGQVVGMCWDRCLRHSWESEFFIVLFKELGNDLPRGALTRMPFEEDTFSCLSLGDYPESG